MRKRSYVSMIEAGYAVEADDRKWLEGLAETANLTHDGAACAYLYDSSQVPWSVMEYVNFGTNLTPEIAEVALPATDDEWVRRRWQAQSVAAMSEHPNFRECSLMREGLYQIGIRDLIAINVTEQNGISVLVGAPLSEEITMSADERKTWSRTARHLSAALRLRLRGASLPSAILSPSGHVEHAAGDAQDPQAREALREAVLRAERARGPMRRREPEAAVGLWTTLVDARWSLLDSFESDGRRYLIAMENPPTAPGPEVLSARERQIVAAAALGRTNKLIAYEMGLSDATVRVLLSRAAKKLGVRTRKELVSLYQAHSAGELRRPPDCQALPAIAPDPAVDAAAELSPDAGGSAHGKKSRLS